MITTDTKLVSEFVIHAPVGLSFAIVVWLDIRATGYVCVVSTGRRPPQWGDCGGNSSHKKQQEGPGQEEEEGGGGSGEG